MCWLYHLEAQFNWPSELILPIAIPSSPAADWTDPLSEAEINKEIQALDPQNPCAPEAFRQSYSKRVK